MSSLNVKQFQAYLDAMPDSAAKSYIVERVLRQIEWYDKQSTQNQKRYKALSTISIALTGIIPVVVLFSDYGMFVKVIVTLMSSVAGIVNTVTASSNSKSLWIQYRSNCETLKSILHMFFLKSGEFNACSEQELIDRLVVNCEKYITEEYSSWAAMTKSIQSTPSTITKN